LRRERKTTAKGQKILEREFNERERKKEKKMQSEEQRKKKNRAQKEEREDIRSDRKEKNKRDTVSGLNLTFANLERHIGAVTLF